MALTVIKNWDNKTWLSSQNYINSFNNFLIKNTNINSNFKILDIGCGRGKILGSLSSRLKLKYKPLGIDIINHKDRDKRIIFKKIDALTFLKKNKKKFDLIFLDPPFRDKNINTLLEKIKTMEVANKNCLIILHRSKKLKEELYADFKVLREQTYGVSKIIFGKF